MRPAPHPGMTDYEEALNKLVSASSLIHDVPADLNRIEKLIVGYASALVSASSLIHDVRADLNRIEKLIVGYASALVSASSLIHDVRADLNRIEKLIVGAREQMKGDKHDTGV